MKIFTYVLCVTTSFSLYGNLNKRPHKISRGTIGVMVTDLPDSSGHHFSNKKVFYAKANYVRGGLSFIYPKNLFSSNPTVTISLTLKKIGYQTNALYVPMITQSTKNVATVRVNKHFVGKTFECHTGSVEVALWAVEQ